MLEDFLNGYLAVNLNKGNREEIKTFYNIIQPYTEEYETPGRWIDTGVLDYLLDKSSGPYHFLLVDNKSFNGGTYNYVTNHRKKICTAEFFIENVKIIKEIQDTDLTEIFA